MSKYKTIILTAIALVLLVTLASEAIADTSLLDVITDDKPNYTVQLPPQDNTLYDFPRILQEDLQGRSQRIGNPYTDYMRITDALELISLRVPTEWQDIESGPWIVEGLEEGIFVAASANLDNFYADGAEPGVFFSAATAQPADFTGGRRAGTPHPIMAQLLQTQRQNNLNGCDPDGSYTYEDFFYEGLYDLYINCTNGQDEMMLSAMPAFEGHVTYLEITLTDEYDMEAASNILDSFQVLHSSLEDDHHEHEPPSGDFQQGDDHSNHNHEH